MNNANFYLAADALYTAMKSLKPVTRLSSTYRDFSISDAYEIQKILVNKMIRQGYVPCGKKIGVTSKAMQDLVGIHEPDYGILFHDLQIKNNG